MKMTDGIFHRTFDQIAAEYPELEHDVWIVDIGAAKLATTPESFDVVVMPNLYGDILSDVTAEISGSVGIAGSANIGAHYAMFEAIHGSAPRIAGQNIANPSGLLLAAVMMMVHIGQPDIATRVHAAWLRTLEDGIHTPDIYRDNGLSRRKVTTQQFAEAVIQNLGQWPQQLKAVNYQDAPKTLIAKPAMHRKSLKQLVGVDLFLDWNLGRPDDLASRLLEIDGSVLTLEAITNRGIKVWPHGFPETFCTDHWRCRYRSQDDTPIEASRVIELLGQVSSAGLDIIKTENLYTFDGIPGFSAIQG